MKEWDFFQYEKSRIKQIIKKQTKQPPQQNPKIVPVEIDYSGNTEVETIFEIYLSIFCFLENLRLSLSIFLYNF